MMMYVKMNNWKLIKCNARTIEIQKIKIGELLINNKN